EDPIVYGDRGRRWARGSLADRKDVANAVFLVEVVVDRRRALELQLDWQVPLVEGHGSGHGRSRAVGHARFRAERLVYRVVRNIGRASYAGLPRPSGTC